MIEMRVRQLKAMHEVMLATNDEDIYMSWITYCIPDEPSEEDFEFAAEDEETYNDDVDLFCKLVAKKGYRV